MDSGGRKVSKTVIAAIVTVAVVVGAVFGSYFISLTPPPIYKSTTAFSETNPSSTTTVTTSTISTTSSTSSATSTFSNTAAGNLTITTVYDDVTLSNPQQLQEMLLDNSTTIGGKASSAVAQGQTFSVQAEIDFQACPCVHYVLSVQSMTPGFVVVKTTPVVPIPFAGIGGDTYTAAFSVELLAPSSAYDGALTLVARCG